MAILSGGIGLPPLYTELKVKTDSFKTEMNKAGHEAVNKANEISRNMQNLSGVGKTLTSIGKTATTYVTLPLAAAGAASGKFARDYETAFAGVRKTVDATEEEYSKLSQGIRDMAKTVPTGAAAIAEVTEAAGQLGIENENLLSFTRVMIDLGESTNLSATEGATQLARFANITRMSQADFDRLGSTIVDLGNNFATTEAEIVAMGMRLAGAGTQIGLTEAQIMGFSTALSSVGIEAEAGGSAFSKVMIDMQLAVETNSERLEMFAEVAGMSGEQFKKAFQEDAASALVAFIEGLGRSEEKGLSAIKVLDDMEISEVRMRDALLRASGASDVFTEALAIGTIAWEENNALTKEAEQRYQTTESQMAIAKNRIVDVGISIGEKLLPHVVTLVDKVADVVEWFGNLDLGTQELILKLGLGALAFGPVTSAVGGLLGIVTKLPVAISAFTGGMKLAAGGASLLSTGAGTLSTALTGTATAAGTAGAAGGLATTASALGAATAAAAPFVLGAGAVALAGYGIYEMTRQKTIPAVDLFTDTVVVSTGAVEGYADSMDYNMKTITRTVSDETKAQVTQFMDLKRDVDQATTEMFLGITATTRANTQEIKDKVGDMTKFSINAVDEQRDRNIASFNELFTESTWLSEEERKKIIEDVNVMATDRKKTINEMKDRLLELYDEIRIKGVENATAEKEEVARLMNELANESVKAMVRNQDEQEIILNNLKNSSGKITQEMVGDVISKLNEQRDKGVGAAEEMYTKQINAALEYKQMMQDNNGQLSRDNQKTYDNMVRQAENLRKDTVSQYEQLRVNGLVKLRDEYGSLATNIDFNTGKIRGFLDRTISGAGEWNRLVFQDKKFTITEERKVINQTYYEQITLPARHGNSIHSNWYNGLDFVPWDGYLARLHKGERIMTAEENKRMKEFSSSGGVNVNIENFANHTKEDVQQLVRRIGREMERQQIARGSND